MTRQQVEELIQEKKQCDYYEGTGCERFFIEISDLSKIIDKIFEEPSIDCSFNNLVNSTIIIR